MASIITVEEINAIFAEFDRLKAKGSGKDNGVETRVSNLICDDTSHGAFVRIIEGLHGKEDRRDENILLQPEHGPQ